MRFKKIILIICASILSVIVLNGVINWIIYTPKYLHLYGKVDSQIGLEAWTVNYTDKKQCSECCTYSIETGRYEVEYKNKKTEININKNGNYSVMIPINLKRIKWGCRWDNKSVFINLFHKKEKSTSDIEISFFENDEFVVYKERYRMRTLLKKSLNIIGMVEYRKEVSTTYKNVQIYEVANFSDPTASYNSYYCEIPTGIDVVELEMNITDIHFENTVETARKIEVD